MRYRRRYVRVQVSTHGFLIIIIYWLGFRVKGYLPKPLTLVIDIIKSSLLSSIRALTRSRSCAFFHVITSWLFEHFLVLRHDYDELRKDEARCAIQHANLCNGSGGYDL